VNNNYLYLLKASTGTDYIQRLNCYKQKESWWTWLNVSCTRLPTTTSYKLFPFETNYLPLRRTGLYLVSWVKYRRHVTNPYVWEMSRCLGRNRQLGAAPNSTTKITTCICRNHNPVLSSFMTYHRMCYKSNRWELEVGQGPRTIPGRQFTLMF
jgi:hypothetical protein